MIAFAGYMGEASPAGCCPAGLAAWLRLAMGKPPRPSGTPPWEGGELDGSRPVDTAAAGRRAPSASPSEACRPESAGLQAHDDWRLVRRCLDEDPDEFRVLVERHQARIAAMMWRFTRRHADHEELVAEVFVQAYKSLRQYRGAAPFAHWLARIATRVGYRYWRQQARVQVLTPLAADDQVAAPAPRPEAMDPDVAAGILHAILGRLPPRDRLVLTLRYLEECDVAETARRTGWSATLVKVQTLRARHKLRRLWAEYERRTTP